LSGCRWTRYVWSMLNCLHSTGGFLRHHLTPPDYALPPGMCDFYGGILIDAERPPALNYRLDWRGFSFRGYPGVTSCNILYFLNLPKVFLGLVRFSLFVVCFCVSSALQVSDSAPSPRHVIQGMGKTQHPGCDYRISVFFRWIFGLAGQNMFFLFQHRRPHDTDCAIGCSGRWARIVLFGPES